MCLHYVIRNLHSMVCISKGMQRAVEKKKQGHVQQHNYG